MDIPDPHRREQVTRPFTATRTLRPRKAARAEHCATLEQLPNIGPRLAEDLRLLGVHHSRELAARDAFELYRSLCAATGTRQARASSKTSPNVSVRLGKTNTSTAA